MKSLIKSIFAFIKSDFSWKIYLSIFLFTVALVVFEYNTFLYDKLDMKFSYTPKVYLLNFLYFSFAYFVPVILVKSFSSSKIKLNSQFWIKGILGIIIISLYVSFYSFYKLVYKLPSPDYYYWYYTLSNASGLLIVVLPLAIIYLIFDRKSEVPFYGANLKHFNFRLALLLSVIAFLIALLGVKFSDVSNYYPIVNRTGYESFAAKHGISKIFSAGLFELSYMFDFAIVELIFRGFMIFAFVKFLGKKAVLPVAVLYTVIHFGKPLPETISSFFGAYILGIIAINQKNIGIGVVLHCVLAFSVEMLTLVKS
ncbi:MAG: hypothetical protein GX378_02855 [Bacteroidales bacterium]|nr:hypothetical protein [Bacteroidales bacterium]